MDTKKITVDDIIGMYYFQYFRVVKDKFITKDGKHYNKAKNDPKLVLAFTKCAKYINEHNIDYVDYISNTFEHYRKFLHPKVLINIGNIRRYQTVIDEREDAKHLTNIYDHLIKSIRFIALQCKVLEFDDINQYMTYCINNDLLAKYLMSGKISKYYLALFRNMENIASVISSPDSRHEIERVVVMHRESINIEARKAIKRFTGNSNVSIINVTNHNINKILGE